MRLIDADGEQLGIVSIEVALGKAKDASLDLVEVSPNAEPPVCRVMDYGKYRYQQNKKQTDAKKKSKKQVQLKEIKFRPGTEEGDYQVKLRNLIRFLESGNKVKITVRFRGREVAYQTQGEAMLNRLKIDLDTYGNVDQMPKMEGRQMVMVLSPKKKV